MLRTLGMRIQLFFLLGLFQISTSVNAQDYIVYHAACREIENSLLMQDWEEALERYRDLDRNYDFLFGKDLKIALQLAYRSGDSASFQRFSEEAFARGWKWKKAKKELKINPDFDSGMKRELKSVAKKAEPPVFLDPEVREQVKRLFVQDQWQALGALFTFSSEKQDRYAERKFAPKATQRMLAIQKVMDDHGFPGEQLIGNRIWAMTMLSHYNSISVDFAEKDILYPKMRVQLWKELEKGMISPLEFAWIENWYTAVVSDRTEASFGLLEGEVHKEELAGVNTARKAIGLPTVEAYNQLLILQEKSGLNLFLGNSTPILIR